MKITINVIPHKCQRYQTPGDYTIEPNGDINVMVSNTGDNRYNLLIAIHELMEVILTQHRGIKEEDIAAFDIQFEKERLEGKHEEWEEAGDSKDAPYKKEHFTATNIERLLGEQLGVDWNDYDEKVISLLNER